MTEVVGPAEVVFLARASVQDAAIQLYMLDADHPKSMPVSEVRMTHCLRVILDGTHQVLIAVSRENGSLYVIERIICRDEKESENVQMAYKMMAMLNNGKTKE